MYKCTSFRVHWFNQLCPKSTLAVVQPTVSIDTCRWRYWTPTHCSVRWLLIANFSFTNARHSVKYWPENTAPQNMRFVLKDVKLYYTRVISPHQWKFQVNLHCSSMEWGPISRLYIEWHLTLSRSTFMEKNLFQPNSHFMGAYFTSIYIRCFSSFYRCFSSF